jgi:hypothetical protein
MGPRKLVRIPSICALVVLLLAAREVAATPILDTGTILFATTGTEFGRLSRDGVPSDWASTKRFPGVTGAPTARAYDLFTVNAGPYPYLQIVLDDPAAALFASAYLGAFTPVNSAPNYGLNVNYLGDAGLTQPVGNPSFFQIVVAPNSTVLIPINELNPGGGAGASFSLLVEGFFDTNYNDTVPPVTEPASFALFGSGAAFLAVTRRRKRSVGRAPGGR